MAHKVARKPRARAQQRNNTTLIIAGGIVAVAVVGLLVLLNLNVNTHPSSAPVVAEGKTWGQAEAPVTIEEYSDFQ
jgi:uncharacterized membrane protein YkgB